MRYQHDCIACSKRQGNRIYNIALGGEPGSSEHYCEKLQQELNEKIDAFDPGHSPAQLSLTAIRAAQKYAGVEDPFVEQKKQNNQLALSLEPDLRKRIEASEDRLRIACLLAACGNIIDLGPADSFDINATIEKVLSEGFQRDEYNGFVAELDRIHQRDAAPKVVYCCDNAGEIVFDRLLIEELQRAYPRLEITAVVRQKPVLNDATLEDARVVGLDQVTRVIDNGNDLLRTVMEFAGDELRGAFAQADVIISKGQANYETLSHQPELIFFILKAKCDVIASSLSVKLYDAVMTRSPYLASKIPII
ncbi:MAG: ARMT1-like domain-containing protein [Candidatus Hinthialibacter antarcticus]|nr:ARMT1-like domain-containing protein [Candidatus Hinthialibacter antarcticus]